MTRPDRRTARTARTARTCIVAVTAVLSACTGATEPLAPRGPDLTAFVLTRADNPSLSADVVGVVDGDTIRLAIEDPVRVDSMVPTFGTTGAVTSFEIDGRPAGARGSRLDLTRDLRVALRDADGATRTFVVRTTVGTGLPIVRLDTDDRAPITSRETYVPASVSVYGGKDHPEWSFTARTQARGRGNSTWHNPKKPYRLKLAAATSMLGFPADRDWVLLANYWDFPLARNATALHLAASLGMAYTPRCTPVELTLNGEPQGSYQLCDHMEVAAHRIPAVGGWFLELNDLRRVEPDEVWFETPAMHEYTTVGHGDTIPSVWVHKQPDAPTPAQQASIRNDLLAFEQALYGPDFADPVRGYAAHLDVRSLVDWYLVMELTKNNDAAFSFGVYLHRPPGGRITFGPVWDFDLAMGNFPYDGGPEGWKILVSGYLPRLLQDPAFVALLKERWAILSAQRGATDAFVVRYTRDLAESQRRTHVRWAPYLPTPLLVADARALALAAVPAFPARLSATEADAEYFAQVVRLRSWLQARYDWLNAHIGAL